MEPPDNTRRVRICRPAFQDMHHLVLPRLVGRFQLRRHALKLRFWHPSDTRAGDLDWSPIVGDDLYALELADGFGMADGFRVVFCDGPNPAPGGTICVLAVLRADEPLTAATLAVLRGRELIARERLIGYHTPGPTGARTEHDDD